MAGLMTGIMSIITLECTGNGKYLYNAVSSLLSGYEDLHCELRLKCTRELIKNCYLYDTNYFDNYSSIDVYENEEHILNGLKNSARNVAALSNVLQIPIQSTYPKICNICKVRDFLNKVFYPQYKSALFEKNIKLRILWSHTTNANLLGWSLNHFVPVIVFSPNANQRTIETSNTPVMKNDHFRGTIY